MKHRALAHYLPRFLSKPLFGDREHFGLEISPDDPDWIAWQQDVCLHFYESTQKQSVGDVVSDAGYRVMGNIDLSGLRVLEIGPGHIRHLRYWVGKPACYVIADIQNEMLIKSVSILKEMGVAHQAVKVERDTALPFSDGEFDAIVSFYALEHMYPFEPYLSEMMRVLKPGGRLMGAIPAEGGMAWGLGRMLTSRRWLKRHTKIDPDKIICWEHPNFADLLLNHLDAKLTRQHLSYWPLRLPLLDLNLVLRFIYVRR